MPNEVSIEAEVAQLAQAADTLYEFFDSVVVIASGVREGRSLWFTVKRGNEFATENLTAKYALGLLGNDPSEGPSGVRIN